MMWLFRCRIMKGNCAINNVIIGGRCCNKYWAMFPLPFGRKSQCQCRRFPRPATSVTTQEKAVSPTRSSPVAILFCPHNPLKPHICLCSDRNSHIHYLCGTCMYVTKINCSPTKSLVGWFLWHRNFLVYHSRQPTPSNCSKIGKAGQIVPPLHMPAAVSTKHD